MLKKALTLKGIISLLKSIVAVAIVVRELTAVTHAIGSNLKKDKIPVEIKVTHYQVVVPLRSLRPLR